MKKILLLYFAISMSFVIITGQYINGENYLSHLSQSLPNFSDVYDNFVVSIQNFNSPGSLGNAGNLFDWLRIFGEYVVNTFNVLFQFLFLPINLIIYIVKVIVAFIPIGSLESANL